MVDACCGAEPTDGVLHYFRMLAGLSRELSSTPHLNGTLGATMASLADAFGLDRALFLMIQHPYESYTPVPIAGRPAPPPLPYYLPDEISEDLLRRPHVRAVATLAPERAEFLRADMASWILERDAWVVPLVGGGALVGLLLCDRKEGLPALTPAERDMLGGMCQNVAIYIYNQIVLSSLTQKRREIEASYSKTKEIYREAIMAFLTAIDIKDGYTKEHSLRVARMAAALAREMGLSDHEVEGIYFAGLLHDIGKILVDTKILNKPDSLDLTEYAEMSQHTRLGAAILAHIGFPWDNLVYTIRHHHDAPAYDDGADRCQRHLDLGTRIIGLIDAFDAMTSDRPYRRALSLAQSFDEIVACLHGQFDPEIARTFFQMVDRDLDRPPERCTILTEDLLSRNGNHLRESVADALLRTEEKLGLVASG